MPFSPAVGFVGVGLEVTPGTGVVPTAYPPIALGRAGQDKIDRIEDTASRGAMVDGAFDHVSGIQSSEFEIPSSPVFADTVPWWLVNILGDYATTGAGDPYTHTASLLNTGDGQCKSLSLTDFYGYTGTHSRRFPGCKVAEVELEWNADGLLMVGVKLVGLVSELVAKPTQSFTTVTATPAWECTATIGGAGNVLVEKGKLTFKRDTSPIPTADGTAAPYKIWQGPLSVEGEMTFVAEDDAEYLRYTTMTKPIVSLVWTHGSPARTVQIVMSKVDYKEAKPDHGKQWMSYEADLKPLPNTTDVGASSGYSPCKATFLNALPASTYA